MLSLLFLESAADLRADWDRSVLSLFGQFAESFRKIDLNEARATHWSIAVSSGAKEKNNENAEDVERPFRCVLVTEREQTCGLTFATWRGLTSHQRRPSGGTHGIRHLASLLIVTNACVLCGTTCKSKWAAGDHLKHAIRHQRCVLDMTHAHVSLEPITSYSCPACCCSFGSATELQWHFRTHFEPYLTPGYLFVWPAHAVVVAGIGARALRGRTVAAAPDQETARRHELSRYRYRAGSGWGRRRPSRAQAEVQAEEQGRGARRRLQRSRPQAHEKEEKKRSSDSSIGSDQKTTAKLEEQLKAARNENKRLVARTQHVDKSKESDGAIESVDDERCAADLDELQTLVDLSNKYFPDSLHNATLREKLDVERKKKAGCQTSPGSDRGVWRRNVKRKRLWNRKSLIYASNSKVRRQAWRCWQWTLMSLRKSCRCCNVVQCSPC